MTINTRIEETGSVKGIQAVNRTIEAVLRVAIGGMVTFAGLTGLWAMAAMISALAKAGGPISLVGAWISAVIGI
jgi:hypothetical protein